jgi:HEAT repeat protein
MDALDQRDYERALREFDQYYRSAGDNKEMRGDGALYWKAYTLHKLGRRDESLATLATLEKTFPSSRWLNDARALQLEVKQATGQGASPEAQTDEDLKLLAINGLMNTDAERVVPLLEKLLADPKTTPRLKSKALFVLGQSRSPRAGEIIAKYAKGGSNPDVQLKAVEYLGIYGTPQNKQVLSDVYGSTNDPALKRAVLRAYMIAKDKDKLLAAAKSESNMDLRREAIRYLGSLGAHAELAQLYSSETNVDAKRAIVQSLGGRREKTPEIVAGMYAGENDKKLKTEMLRSLHSQGAAKQLVDIARKETDPSLKQEAVRELSRMNSKEAQDYLMELLNR